MSKPRESRQAETAPMDNKQLTSQTSVSNLEPRRTTSSEALRRIFEWAGGLRPHLSAQRFSPRISLSSSRALSVQSTILYNKQSLAN